MTVKIKIDNAEFDVEQNVANHITALSGQVEAQKSRADSLEAERDAMKVKVDGIPALIEEAVTAEKSKADELASLIATASDAGIKCDGLDAKGIKLAYIKEIGGVDASDKNDAYINTAFEFARESDKMAANRVKIHGEQGKQDGEDKDGVKNPQARFRK